MSRAPFRGAIAAALLVGFLIAVSVATSWSQSAPAVARIEVAATPIDAFDPRNPAQKRFGALEFRGGLVLRSDYRAFGGFSALHVEPNGERFVSVSDHGTWLGGRIVYRDGKPDQIADAEMAPLIGADGKPLRSRGWFDAESLTERDGMLYVGLERVEQIVRFNYKRDGLLARGDPIPVPPDFKSFTFNKSLECIAAAKKDSPLGESLVVVTEHSLDNAGNFRSFVLGDGEPIRFSVKRVGNFDASDCALSPGGDLLLLERSFSLLGGLGMRIRRIALSGIKEGVVVDGPQLIEADLGYEIDNMEGIGVHRNARGEIIITLISDDNFLPFQRTLLLQFALIQ